MKLTLQEKLLIKLLRENKILTEGVLKTVGKNVLGLAIPTSLVLGATIYHNIKHPNAKPKHIVGMWNNPTNTPPKSNDTDHQPPTNVISAKILNNLQDKQSDIDQAVNVSGEILDKLIKKYRIPIKLKKVK